MLMQMIDCLIEQDPSLSARRAIDVRRYIVNQWNRTHEESIDEDGVALFLNARMVAQVLGVSISTANELHNDPGYPTLRGGSRMVVPKEKFIQWAEGQSGGAK